MLTHAFDQNKFILRADMVCKEFEIKNVFVSYFSAKMNGVKFLFCPKRSTKNGGNLNFSKHTDLNLKLVAL